MAFLSFFLSWVQLFDRVIFLIFFVLSLFGPVVSFSKIWPLKFLDREVRLLPRTLFSGIETRVATGLMSGFNGVVSGRGGVGWDTYILILYNRYGREGGYVQSGDRGGCLWDHVFMGEGCVSFSC